MRIIYPMMTRKTKTWITSPGRNSAMLRMPSCVTLVLTRSSCVPETMIKAMGPFKRQSNSLADR